MDRNFHLVTVAGQALHAKANNIFLGVWCTYQDSDDHFLTVDTNSNVTATPWLTSFAEIDEHIVALRRLEDTILDKITELQDHFGVETCTRLGWQIRLGYWTQFYVGFMYRKIQALEKVLANYEINSASFYKISDEKLTPNDTLDFLRLSSDSQYSSSVDLRIWNVLTRSAIKARVISTEADHASKFLISPKIFSRLKFWLYWKLDAFAAPILRRQKYLLITTYLPIKQEILTHIALKQIPFIRHKSHVPRVTHYEKNLSFRNQLSDLVTGPFDSHYDEIIMKNLFLMLPMCFIEGAASIEATVNLSSLPRDPKLIFSSNSFAFDEVFKFWLSRKVEAGSTYIAGQHGNNYGTSKLFQPIESETASYFLTWGWVKDADRDIPAFNFKTSGVKLKHNPKGRLTLMHDSLPKPVFIWDSDYDFCENVSMTKKLIEELIPICRDNLTVRLHPDSQSSPFNERAKLQESFPRLHIDQGTRAINSILRGSRIVVHTYDSTGMLENFSLGIPCLVILNRGLTHLDSVARLDYQKLVDAKIIFFDVNELVHHLSCIWDEVDIWWNSEKVQFAVTNFSFKYSRNTSKPSRDLVNLLVNLSD